MGAWNNPIIVPRQTSPWENVMSQMIGNLALAHIQHKWQMDTMQNQREYEQQRFQEQREYIKATKPDAPEGMTAYFTGKEWKMTKTPAGEMEAERFKSGLQEKRELSKTIFGEIAKGNLVRVPDEEIKMMQQPQLDQLIKHDGKYYVNKGDPGATTEELLGRANKLRGEFTSQSKTFVDVRDSYLRILESAKDPSPAGDLALIFNYMKMLDPGSTVREGEFANAENSAGIPNRIKALYNKVVSGERLAAETRNDFVNRSRSMMKAQRDTHKQLTDQYTRLAKDYGVSPNKVIVDYTRPDPKYNAPKWQGPGEYKKEGSWVPIYSQEEFNQVYGIGE